MQHQVAEQHRVIAPGRPESTLVEAEHDGLNVYQLVNNFTWSRAPLFDYFCPGLERPFLEVLHRFRPDLVHFQHLGGGLSTSFLSLAAGQGLPTVVTLHDFWCLCARSHLLTAEGELCPGPEGGLRCADCRPPAVYAPPLGESLHALRAEAVRWGWWPTLRRLPGYALSRLLRPLVDLAPLQRDVDAGVRAACMARDRYFQSLLELPDAILAPSRFLAQVFERWGVERGRMLHLQNGVDPRGLRRERVPAPGRLRLAYLGSIVPHKGLGVLIEAMRQLESGAVELCIYGDDQATPETAAYAATLRRSAQGAAVRFMGPLPHEEVGRALAATDALVLPSLLYENCPLSMLEALYARVPVIASGHGGMAELVQDGVNGLLFRTGDAGHLAAQIARLAAQPQLLDSLRQGIRPPPTAAEVSAAVERVYGEVLALRRAGQAGVAAQRALVARLGLAPAPSEGEGGPGLAP